MNVRRLILPFVLVSAAACAASDVETPAVRSSTARGLGIFSPRLADDAREQARIVLAQDARRRENRFLDALKPGHLAGATRVDEKELAAGLLPPSEVFEIGAQLFHQTFTKEMGFGGRDLPARARFHKGERGGPDATSCAQCHWRGGPAGAGDGADAAFFGGDGDSQASALARNPIALAGDGYVELLAREMTAELARERDALVAAARAEGVSRRGALVAKGVAFGLLEARADGSIDTRLVEGVDSDLVVRPFGHKGTFASLRDVVEDALVVHHGMQSSHFVRAATPERAGPFGGEDPDGDGVVDEIVEGQVTALTMYVAMQEVPVVTLPGRFDIGGITATDMSVAWARGRAAFDAVGCGSCHTPSLRLESPRYALPSRVSGKEIAIDLHLHGGEPRLAPAADGAYSVELFSDLKRHDMGPALREARADRGVPGGTFLTRPLWGVARSRPYLHDGRAPTLEDAIVLHGGEAQTSRDAFLALEERERAGIRVFLTSLTRARRIVAQ